MAGTPLWVWVLAVVAVLGVLLALYTYQYRSAPGVSWLVGMHTTFAVYTAFHVVAGVIAWPDNWLVVLDHFEFALSIVASILWFVFVLAYTGQVRITTRHTYAVLAGLGTLCLVNITGPVHGLVFAETAVVQPGAVAYVDSTPGAVYVPQLFGVLFIAVTGIGLLTRVLFTQNQLFSRQAVALILGSTGPYIAAMLDVMDKEPAPAMPLIPFGFLVMSVTLTYASSRGGLFEVVPATERIGESTALEQLDDAIFITSRDGTILNANRQARTLFDSSGLPLVGEQFADLHEATTAPGDLPRVNRVNGTTFETNCTTVEGPSGGVMGYTIRCSDVSEQIRRQQRLEVMNRIFRHNVRNDLNVVEGFANQLEETDDPAHRSMYADKINSSLDDIITLTEKARAIEETLERDPSPESVDLSTFVRRLETTLVEKYPDASIESDVPADASLVTSREHLQTALSNLLENAVEHHDKPQPHVTLTVTTDARSVEFVIEDNGPGIPQNEVDSIETGTETQSQHGSGLGLWMVKWVVEDLEGDLVFDVSNRGTTVRLTVPSLDASTAE